MSSPIIEVRGLSKSYQLGHIGFTSARDEVERLWRRLQGRAPAARDSREFHALRDVSFTVAPGEVLGLIGRNGAGKSTLLKILAEITDPTAGEVVLRGHVASLLEVGTGFHPELSGRENIFLNGAILGMKRAEIARKFDEIVAFAEIERFLDTPVKRYSSGMYVRLAFAVAAHLEPEILLVDEVLAVGDHAFQQKCLGKMQDVARAEGRTVIFVSHNMAAVSRFCTRAVLLESGRLTHAGAAEEVVANYLAGQSRARARWQRPAPPLPDAPVALLAASAGAPDGLAGIAAFHQPVDLFFDCRERASRASWRLRVSIHDRAGHELLCSCDSEAQPPRVPQPGRTFRARCRLPAGLLKPGSYTVSATLEETAADIAVATLEEHESLLTFEVSDQGYRGATSRGLLGQELAWSFTWPA